jgi:peptidoglycan/xylan/chitin deacetylase (PgdA/CDA1 family)
MRLNHKLPITNRGLKKGRLLLSFSLLAVLLASCQPAVATADPGIVMTAAIETAFAQINITTATLAPTETPIPTATVQRTPPALPPAFTTTVLNPLDVPHTYIQDSCQYLKAKWDPNNAAPGTIVMVIMFHGINKDSSSLDANDITVKDFNKLMGSLKELGFEAINATQLADFLDSNARIPQRSVVLTYDDRHTAQAFEHFRPYYEKWGWPVINGWISAFGGDDQFLQENVNLSNEGWVDYQAHGVIHNINIGPNSTEEFIHSELQGSIDNLQKYFQKTPIAYIWPGGGFTARGVQVAREVGYRVGFTINPRGPIMFNWIPLSDAPDAGRPAFIPEGPANDPRLTLPRYWPMQVLAQLDTIRVMGKDAAAYAEQNKAIELEYYDIVCAPTFGSIPPTP